MFEKLESVVDKYEELTKKVADPDVIANQERISGMQTHIWP